MAFAISLRRPRSTNAALELTETSVSKQTKLNPKTNIIRHQLTGWGRNGEEKAIRHNRSCGSDEVFLKSKWICSAANPYVKHTVKCTGRRLMA